MVNKIGLNSLYKIHYSKSYKSPTELNQVELPFTDDTIVINSNSFINWKNN